MNDGLKQRLIGAVILVALAIILWPFVFGPQPEPTATNKPVVEQPPPFKQFEIPEPQPGHDVPDVDEYQRQLRARQQAGDSGTTQGAEPVKKASAEGAASAPAPASATPSKSANNASSKAATGAPPAKAGLDDHGLPVAWVVQVGSFGNAANATSLMAKLQQKGYHAATQETTTDKGTFTRVFIGPTVDHEHAQKTLEAIRKLYPHARLERFIPPTDGFGG